MPMVTFLTPVWRRRLASPVDWMLKISRLCWARWAGSDGTKGICPSGCNNFLLGGFLGGAGQCECDAAIGLLSACGREAAVIQSFVGQTLQIKVGQGDLCIKQEALRLRQQAAVLGDQRMPATNRIGGGFVRAGSSIQVACQATGRLLLDQFAAIFCLQQKVHTGGGVAKIVAPASAMSPLGGEAVQTSSQISTPSTQPSILPAAKSKSVPKGTSTPSINTVWAVDCLDEVNQRSS